MGTSLSEGGTGMRRKLTILVLVMGTFAISTFLMVFTNPSLLNHTKPERDVRPYATLLYRPLGRVGNRLFQIAALLATSRTYNLIPALPPEVAHMVCDVIDLKPFKIMRSSEIRNKQVFEPKLGGKFDDMILRLSPTYNWTFDGYFQSWKYFDVQDGFVRQNMKLNETAVSEAKRFLGTLGWRSKSREEITLIGIHVRRGDFLWKRHGGFAVPGKDYILRAIEVYRKKYPENTIKVVFVSDDIRWCRENFQGAEFEFSPFMKSISTDLALLSLCDHLVITGGTFGWMGAWFCNCDVIYYHGYPTPGTYLDGLISKADYYPSDWIGLF